MRSFRNPAWLAAFVALVAFALYLPSLGYDFVYDSAVQVGVDDFIHQPRHLLDCLTLRVLGMDVLDSNRPLNLVSLIADALLWGKNPAGFRLTNLLLHAASAALLFRWLRSVTGSAGASFLAALLFAVHPLHTETVVEVGYREDLLVTFFLLAGVNAAAAFNRMEKSGRRVWGPGLLAFACFFLAAASKENGVAGPTALLSYWIFLRREPGQTAKPWLALIGATGVAVVAFYALRFGLEPVHSVIFTEKPQPIAANGIDWALAQSRIWTAEAARVAWPSELCADYGPYNLRGIDPLWALVTVAGLAVAGVALSVRSRRAALGCVLAVAALLPVSNFVPIYRPMADRYLYLPMTGLALLAALALARIRPGKWRNAAWGLTGAAAVALAAATVREETFWRDGASLWAEATRVNPVSSSVWAGRGDAACERGRYEKAVAFYQRADTLAAGKSAPICASLALAWEGLREPKQAADALRRATKLDSRFARPETLRCALIFREDQIGRFMAINRRGSSQ